MRHIPPPSSRIVQHRNFTHPTNFHQVPTERHGGSGNLTGTGGKKKKKKKKSGSRISRTQPTGDRGVAPVWLSAPRGRRKSHTQHDLSGKERKTKNKQNVAAPRVASLPCSQVSSVHTFARSLARSPWERCGGSTPNYSCPVREPRSPPPPPKKNIKRNAPHRLSSPSPASPARHGDLHPGGRHVGAHRVKIPHGRHIPVSL